MADFFVFVEARLIAYVPDCAPRLYQNVDFFVLDGACTVSTILGCLVETMCTSSLQNSAHCRADAYINAAILCNKKARLKNRAFVLLWFFD